MTDLVEPLAIIGFAGKFPGAGDTAALWQLLRDGREGLRTLTDEQLLAAGVSEHALRDPNYVRVNGDIDGLDMFDAPFFQMTPREATICDPQLRIFLETAHAAVENAGYDPTSCSDVGVYAATGHSLYMDDQMHGAARAAGQRDLLAGVFNYPDYVATLASYKLNFTGPSMTVLTACSSSLLTLHLAAQALNSGECEMALIGGTEVETWNQGYFWTSGGPLSRDGHCRPFDAGASGTVFSTGVGVVALKRLADAVRDGDTIRAVVRGTAVNNDGADKMGFSAPSVSGQTAVVTEALAVAGVDPESIGYVEAHGTGTAMGDPIEFAALTEAFRRAAGGRALPSGYCGLGSVKGNIGHLGHAAGVSSLIKVALCFDNDLLPPTINLDRPNPGLTLDDSPFVLLAEPRSWPRVAGQPRRAGVNSLGFGGTNVHAILEEPPAPVPAPHAQRPRVVVWSGRSAAAEQAYRAVLAEHLTRSPDDFPATVATLQEGRTRHTVRAALVAGTAAEAARALTGAEPAIRSDRSAGPRPVAFLFPGQGSQHAGMAAGLYGRDPVFTAELDRVHSLVEAAGVPARRVWRDGTDADLLDTAVAQPLLFAVEYALAQMWRSWGITASALLGHSLGELVAAAVAEIIPLPDAVAMAVARGRAMAAAPPGAMLAVNASLAEIGELPPEVTVAACNGPKQTVLAGPEPAITDLSAALAGRRLAGVRLRTANAFHSPLMAPAVREFAAGLDGLVAKEPAVPVFSAATAAPLTAHEAGQPSFWADQIQRPVMFAAALDALAAGRDWLLLEVGPGQALTSVLRRHPAVEAGGHDVVATLPRRSGGPEADLRCALTALGALWAEGHRVNWAALRPDGPLRRVPVPGYQYQRRRYWIEDEPSRAATGGAGSGDTAAASSVASEPDGSAPPAADAAWSPTDAFSVLGWVEQPAPPVPPTGAVPTAVLLPPDPQEALHLVLCLQQAGMHITPVRLGDQFRDGGAEFTVRAGETEDMRRVLRAMAERGRPAQRLVHAWGVGPFLETDSAGIGEQLELTVYSLLDLVQQGARAHTGTVPEVLVLTTRSVDVSGGEPLDTAKMTLHGIVRTLALELPERSCRLVDIGPGVSEDELVAELCRVAADPVVALRRDRRWVSAERPYPSGPQGSSPLRRGGVYLITGGLGGLGLELAKGIARAGLRPRLALLGRSAIDQDGPADGGDPDGRIRAGLAELAALGAQVHLFAADVADARAVRRVVDTVTARVGPLNGVFHLAGVPGDGMLLLRDRDAVQTVLRPKVAGTLVLAEVLAGRPQLDFFVAFSSRAAVGGLVGSGDYAAANAFLDGFAATSTLAECRTLSLAWPSWSTVGMAAAGPSAAARPADGPRWHTVLTCDHPFLDEHRIDGTAVLPGTGQLDLVMTALAAECLGEADTVVRLREVVLRQPLVVTGPRRVTIAFQPAESGWTFTLSTEPSEGGPGVVHATGSASAEPGTAPTVDVEAIRGRLSDRRAPDPLNAPGRLFTFGPRWNNTTELSFLPAGGPEKLVSVTLPDQFRADLDDHPLHPALLDTAVSSARDPERDGIFLPFMYQSVVVYGRLPATFASHIVRRPAPDGLILADITLVDEDGRVLAAFEGFTMRTAQRDYLKQAETVAGSTAQRASTPEATRVAAGDTVGEDAGIPPEVGVRLMLELLRTRPPRQVVVRPFRQGRPVPLPAAAAADRPVPLPVPPAAPTIPAAVPAPAVPATPDGSPTPGGTSPGSGGDGVAERLRRLWISALGVEDVATTDDFFDLGGNSLSAIDLMTRIRVEFGVELNIAALFDYPTFDGVTEMLRGQLRT
ncbi:type I polyketide synthase [Rugosimonospora africana]|uniref:Acyl transferase domain-containing protein n=1 Tax=Rugosimonospora africana TaxID=556532 RepID=A0A8J3R0I3_9ACTN|nr:type I polyketide synthase [Rugosimonospora africana]GIH19619.1 hypothetical protein Raf01_77910 [Rugosimonospora africana]